ncbi:MAG: leucyl/phenylalanyl-tRNA--protein transferase [Gammaproteobacteria bacterium]|nr:leucyl/phenylalanyl-tRNA--protein transferase [Gammaproteobacteria bacterium]MCI0590184.1 leucyl/phenylalanyl-tRNA--protein transferase [Gammaproteobacteria bacterium]
MRNKLYWISDQLLADDFPDVAKALAEPDGLLAIGGDLDTERLLDAYRTGIFPWYSEGQPILWWSPDPRSVLFPQNLKVSRSLRKFLRMRQFHVTSDQAFRDVLLACAEARDHRSGTWITSDMIEAYYQLHVQKYAHSIECWHDGKLVGGLYGIALGRVFFGESMFSNMTNASKVGLVYLVRKLLEWDFKLIDCQVHSKHLERLGAVTIPRQQFVQMLDQWCDPIDQSFAWHTIADS